MKNREKLIKQLFVGKVAEVIGTEKTYDLLKESTDAINKLQFEDETQKNILNWATEKGIFEHATPQTQMKKLFEEVHELDAEISKLPYAYKKDVQLEFGDVLVVLTILAKMLDTDFETCLSLAYDKIKTRTGKMENGTFVKY